MAEYLDIVDENGIPTGETVEHETTHAKGFRHRPRLTQKHLRACLPANRQPQQKIKSRKPLKIKAFSVIYGAPEGIRIPDLPLRRRMLYPTELLAHI